MLERCLSSHLYDALNQRLTCCSKGCREIIGDPQVFSRTGHNQSSVGWTAIRGLAATCIYGMRDKERESGRHIARLTPTSHCAQSSATIRSTADHRHNERLHEPGCRHTAAYFADASFSHNQLPCRAWRLARRSASAMLQTPRIANSGCFFNSGSHAQTTGYVCRGQSCR